MQKIEEKISTVVNYRWGHLSILLVSLWSFLYQKNNFLRTVIHDSTD